MQTFRILRIALVCFVLLWEGVARLRLLPISPPSTQIVSLIRNFSTVNDTHDLPKLFAGQTFVDGSMDRRGVGSGILIRSDGLVFTNAHVVRACDKLSVSNRYGSVPASVEKVSERADVALLRLSLQVPSHSARAFFSLADPVPADRVKVFGFPLADLIGSAGAFSEGIVNTDTVRDRSLFQVSAQVHSGNSGSAIVNRRGEIIGLVTSKLDAIKFAQKTGELVQGINFGVKARELASLLPTLVVQAPPVGALGQISGWFAPREEQIAFDLNRYSVRIDCWASARSAAVPVAPQSIVPPPVAAGRPADPIDRYRSASPPLHTHAKERRGTALRLVSVEKVSIFHYFFVHNTGTSSVLSVRIGYRFSPGKGCSDNVLDYDGVASVAVLIPPGVTERAFSDSIPRRAQSFCVINSAY